jgi:hypothetical protein
MANCRRIRKREPGRKVAEMSHVDEVRAESARGGAGRKRLRE